MRLLVRWLRRRRHIETPLRIRALEVGLGYVEPTFVEAHSDPDLIDWGPGRRGRRERERHEQLHGHPPKGGYMAADVSVSEMGPLPGVLTRPGAGVPGALKYGQQCPRGVVRPPLVTVRQETPPPATYVPQDRS